MSLINDALKKAQRERSGPASLPPAAPPTPPSPGAPGVHPAPRPRGNPWPIALVVVALLGGGTAVWFLKPAAPAPAAANEPAAPIVVAATEPAAPVSTPPPAEPSLQFNLPAVGAPAAAAPVAPAASSAAPSPAPLNPPTAATPEPAPASSPAFKVTLQMEDPRVLAFLDAARINGVRSVADDAKLLMNNKVFRAGATVDRELGLKLVQILPTELVFEDSHGIQYRKAL